LNKWEIGRFSMDNKKNIIAILGPKGGVGKSTISANLAIALSSMGKKVVAVDLDLGASNLHAIFGMRESQKNLSDFIQNRVKNLTDVVSMSPIDDLSIIHGGDDPGIANMPYQKKMKLIRHLSSLNYDQVLLDLAPGTSFNVVDFAIIAQQALLVTTCEVPSLLNVYSFIKSTLHRRLTFFFKHNKYFELLELFDKAKEPEKYPHLKTMEGFFEEAMQIDANATESAKKIVSSLSPLLVINRIRSEKDTRAGEVINRLLKEYLSIKTSVIMTIRDDDAVGDAIAKLSPVMIEAPESPFSEDIRKIASNLC